MEYVKRRKNESGQSIVEAAFVIPLLLLVLCGMMDFGWIFSNQLMIHQCSREGARYASVHSDAVGLASLVTQRVRQVAGIGDPADLSVSVQVANGDVRVTVSKPLQVITPLAGIFVDEETFQLSSTSVMRVE